MVGDILEVMELIVKYLFTLAEEIRAVAINLFYGIAFILILATLPIWILPFLIWRSCKRDDHDDSDDDYDYYMNLTR